MGSIREAIYGHMLKRNEASRERLLIMRNCSKIECETVAARLACQRLVTVIVSSNSVDHQKPIGI